MTPRLSLVGIWLNVSNDWTHDPRIFTIMKFYHGFRAMSSSPLFPISSLQKHTLHYKIRTTKSYAASQEVLHLTSLHVVAMLVTQILPSIPRVSSHETSYLFLSQDSSLFDCSRLLELYLTNHLQIVLFTLIMFYPFAINLKFYPFFVFNFNCSIDKHCNHSTWAFSFLLQLSRK